eukprot:TCONS_00041124-protein
MIYMVEYLSNVCTFGVACYIIFGFAIIPSFVRYPKHTSAVHYVFLLFHFCDGILGYIFLMLEKSSFHLWLLCFGKYINTNKVLDDNISALLKWYLKKFLLF